MLILALIGLAALTEPALPHKRMDAAASPLPAGDSRPATQKLWEEGDTAGKKLAALLRAHILVAAEVVTAAKAGNREGLAAAHRKRQRIGDDIAAFLSGADTLRSRPAMQ
jgi:hypothetical protein